MFGLGLMELLVIAAVVAAVAGPAGIKKLMATAKSVRKAKSSLTGRGAIERLVKSDDD